MAVGLDVDGDYMSRTGIPSGGAGTLTNGAFADFFVGIWAYFPSAGNSYVATAGGNVLHGVSGAREIYTGKNNVGSLYTDPQLIAMWDSGGPTQTSFTVQPAFDVWQYFYYTADATNMTSAWRTLGSDTWNSHTNANTNAGSQYINNLYFGSQGITQVLFGRYAYARAVAAAKTAAQALTYSKSSVTETGDWGFWPLDNNTDTADDSGNARTLTFGGTLTSETSPTLDGGPPANTASVAWLRG